MQLQKLCQVAVKANDLDEAKQFYEDVLGAKYISRFDPPGLLFFDFDGVRLLFEKTAPTATLYMHVDDIDAATNELKAKGIEFFSEPHVIFKDDEGLFGEAGKEEWQAFFHDPSENIISLVERR